ncbi:DNA-3-methyladenine glycosylase 2 family protein [Methanolobus zinderi]|uniref:DNA-3-methyladenine glycosylase 2 family protein n=1 Tax=Methanolobus zinderi TaxID=536044 RepID=A0A7D5I3W0_9EURY|nr:DNA-3-methyladenine glycosylase [Methanolobus zinderi]QLC49143.1 DNA-3-methyladenine glycosylase 2 family protein [Methanolobus zinderi]
MHIFRYGQKELKYLKERDKALGSVIGRIGMLQFEVIPDIFAGLVRSIVFQQISIKAATSIWNRMLGHFKEISPERISSATIEEIQNCGLSARKAISIKEIAMAEMQGELNLSELRNLSDEEVIRRLSALRGIGVWTAEMVLIFSMERPDVVSWSDLGIRQGMMRLYGLKTLTKEQFEKYRKRYSPYGSIASLYLWRLPPDL